MQKEDDSSKSNFHAFVGIIRQLGYCDANTLIGSEPNFLSNESRVAEHRRALSTTNWLSSLVGTVDYPLVAVLTLLQYKQV